MAQFYAFQLYLLIFFWEMICSRGFLDLAHLLKDSVIKKMEVKIVVTILAESRNY